MEATLSDFGLAIILNSENQQVKGKCSTGYYMAPEVASRNSYGFSTDIWSLGVMLLTLVVGYLPFCNSSDKHIHQKVKANKFEFLSDIKPSEEFKDIVSKMLNLNPEERLTVAQIQNHPFFLISELEASSSDRISKISEYQLTSKELDSKPKILANGCHPGIINRTSDIHPHCISKIQILEHIFKNLKRFIIGDNLFNSCMFNNTPSYMLNNELIFVGRATYLKNQKVLLYKLNDKTQGALFIDNTNISYNPKNIKYQYTKADSGSNFSHTNNQVLYFPYNIPKNLSKKFEFFDKYRNEISKRIPSLMPMVEFKCFGESLIVTYFSIVLGNGVFILSTGEIQVTFKDKYKLLFSKGGHVFLFVDPLGIIITFNRAYVVNAATSVYFINQDKRAVTAYNYLIKAKVIFEHIIKDNNIGSYMNN